MIAIICLHDHGLSHQNGGTVGTHACRAGATGYLALPGTCTLAGILVPGQAWDHQPV